MAKKAKTTHINVKVSVESIRDALRKLIVSGHSQLITDVIIGNLESTEVGLDQLYQSLSGVRVKFKYKVGDNVLAKPDSLYSWKFDINAMQETGQIIHGRVKAVIVEVDPYSKLPYGLQYTCVKSVSGVSGSTEQSSVDEDKICLEEEWPENMGDDLPF